MRRAYLAGPEVFLSNANEVLDRKKAICTQYGIEGVSPFDTSPPSGLKPKTCGLLIAGSNLDLISSCDMVIANITPFRGPSVDPGTALEMGWGARCELPVYAYSNVNSLYRTRVLEMVGCGRDDHHDTDGYEIEDFDLPDNLMIPGIIEISGGYLWLGNHEDIGSIADTTFFEELVRSLSPL